MTTPRTITFFVPGLPATGGSKRGFPIKRKSGKIGVVITDDCKRNGPWMAAVSAAAMQFWPGGPTDLPVRVDVMFHMPRPKSHRGARRLRPSAPKHHTQIPDRGKMLRAVEDAMTGIVYHDDAQVIGGDVCKKWTEGTAGAGITITETPHAPD